MTPTSPAPAPAACLTCVLAGTWLALSGTAVSQTTWNGTSGSWFTPGNWDTTTVPIGGTVSIENGGQVTIENSLVNGTATTGALRLGTTGALRLGTTGASTGSTLTVESGGKLATTGNTVLGLNAIGGPATRSGAVVVTGAGSEWQANGGSLSIGAGSYSESGSFTALVGSGSLSVLNGGLVRLTGANAILGSSLNGSGAPVNGHLASRGNLLVSGEGSRFTTDGRLYLGYGGTSTLTVAEGGVLAMTGANRIIDLGDRGGSHVYLNIGAAYGEAAVAAGILDVQEIRGDTTFSFSERIVTFNHTNADYVFSTDGTLAGQGVAITGQITLSHLAGNTTLLGGTHTYRGGTFIDGGTLKLVNGAQVTSSASYWIGNGEGKTAGLILESGSKVGFADPAMGGNPGQKAAHVGGGGSTGSVVVRGAGSEWWVSKLDLGWDGDGSLAIEDGGLVSGNQTAGLGGGIGMTGTAVVSGANSRWILTGNGSRHNIGVEGTGSLTIENGGAVSARYGTVGVFGTGDGTVLVTGANSQWSTQGGFDIGYSGKGLLTVADGGRVLDSYTFDGADNFVVARDAGSTGTVRINGTGESRGTLEVFRVIRGQGTALVEFDGGTLKSKGATSDLFTGFTTGEVVLKAGGGTLDTNGFNTAVSIGLTGTGGLRKAGMGTLKLTGVSTYSGATDILAGKLVMNGGLTRSDVTVRSGAIVGGSGTFGGDVHLMAGGMLAPGNSVGTMNFTGDLVLDVGAVYQWEMGAYGTQAGTDSDLISLKGTGQTLTFLADALVHLNFIDGVVNPDSAGAADFWLSDHEWVIATAAEGATLVNEGVTFSGPSSFANGAFKIEENGSQLLLRYTAVPEPSAALVCCLGAGLLLIRRRVRRNEFPG